MIAIEKFDHVGIRVREKSRSIDFYAGLGFALLTDVGFEKGHPVIMQHPSGVVINLLGRATYEPGWVWSKHVGPLTGQKSCMVEHVGQTLSGHAKVKMDDGSENDLLPGDFFYVPPILAEAQALFFSSN